MLAVGSYSPISPKMLQLSNATMLNDNIIIDFMQMAIRYSNQNLTLRNYNEIDNTLCPQLTITVAPIKATGVKKMIVNRSCSWILHASSIGNAQRLVHRMCTLPLGCKGLINGYWFVREKGVNKWALSLHKKKGMIKIFPMIWKI